VKYFTSDWHLSHESIIKFSKRPFGSIEEMDDAIIKNVLSVLKDGDSIYFLGDLSWRAEATFKFFNQLSGGVSFFWILGNHDKGWQKYKNRCASVNQTMETKIRGNNVFLCHYPMVSWNKSHYNSWQLFGHHHKHMDTEKQLDEIIQGKMLNVNLEFNDFKMFSEDDVYEIMMRKKDNWDLIK